MSESYRELRERWRGITDYPRECMRHQPDDPEKDGLTGEAVERQRMTGAECLTCGAPVDWMGPLRCEDCEAPIDRATRFRLSSRGRELAKPSCSECGDGPLVGDTGLCAKLKYECIECQVEISGPGADYCEPCWQRQLDRLTRKQPVECEIDEREATADAYLRGL